MSMSWNPAIEPGCPDDVGFDAIETLIVPRARDLGGFEVRRALPAPKRQMVGPFIFFDQAGPAELLTGHGIDVRPHPHIGLGTVTYLYRGDFHHRDSTGADQIIRPGELNWMVAGRGVSHSERTTAAARTGPNSLFGIQTWLALPESHEDMEPTFEGSVANFEHSHFGCPLSTAPNTVTCWFCMPEVHAAQLRAANKKRLCNRSVWVGASAAGASPKV
jgi:hypothetical protein